MPDTPTSPLSPDDQPQVPPPAPVPPPMPVEIVETTFLGRNKVWIGLGIAIWGVPQGVLAVLDIRTKHYLPNDQLIDPILFFGFRLVWALVFTTAIVLLWHWSSKHPDTRGGPVLADMFLVCCVFSFMFAFQNYETGRFGGAFIFLVWMLNFLMAFFARLECSSAAERERHRLAMADAFRDIRLAYLFRMTALLYRYPMTDASQNSERIANDLETMATELETKARSFE